MKIDPQNPVRGISPQKFVVEMHAFWTRPRTEQDQHGVFGLGNVFSPALGDIWAALAFAVNHQIAGHHDPDERHRFNLLGPECGSGKTVGTAVAISMLPAVDHPGVLYVCQRKVQADDVAALINARAGEGTAFAYHEDHKIPPAAMWTFPVLVMTHSMFGRVAEAVLDGRPLKVAYEDFTTWGLDGRKLIVVDEAFQAVEDYEVHPEHLSELIGAFKGHALRRQQFSQQIEILDKVLDQALAARDRRRELKRTSFDAPSNLTVRPEPLMFPADVSFDVFKQEIPKLRLRGGGKYGDVQAKRQQVAHDFETLKNVLSSLRTWAYYTEILKERGPEGILHSSRLILPDSIRGALFLDATADTTVAYQLFPESRLRRWATRPARSYRNVSLHVSYGHATGVRERPGLRKDVRDFMSALQRDVPKDSKVLVVTHKRLAHAFEDYRGASVFTDCDVMTWGAIDGSNAWQDFDTIAIFTLFHFPPRWALGTYMALQGLQNEKWLNEYQEILKSIHEGHLISSLVQAIGRIRCRRVVDKDGNCSPARVYLALGAKSDGDRIVASIRAMLPALPEPNAWRFTGAQRKAAGRPISQHSASLVKLMEGSDSRWWSATEIQATLGMNNRKEWNDMTTDLRNPQSTLYAKLTALRVRYHVEGVGRGSRSWLVKE